MADLNKVCVIGRMTRDIGERDYGYTTNGKAKLSISIAVNDGYGENKSVSYFDVVYWGKPAEAIKGYLHKGKQIGIEGRLKQDRWEKDGRTNTRVYIIADNMQLLAGNQAENDGGHYQSAPQQDNGDGFPEDVPF
jgi:single-strand DNA-binding protein